MSRIRVLLADDNRPIRDLLASALACEFCVLPTVADGRALVEAALAHNPDVIVTDVKMPVLDGIEAMRVLKGLGCRSPFILISADTDIAAACLEAGAVAFVPKDRASELAAVIHAAVAAKLHAREPDPLPADAQRAEIRSRSNQ